MGEAIVMCPAKVNLFLNIAGKENDMHLLKMFNQSVDLYDYINIKLNDTGAITFSCDNADIPTDDTNSCIIAASLMQAYYNLDCGFDIKLTKNIPMQSGLGGESTDAAGIILGIKDLCNLDIPLKDLMSIGFQVGADVPFCLNGGACLVNSKGEHVTKVKINANYHFIIIQPNFGIDTPYAFYCYDKTCAEYTKFDEYTFGYNDMEIIAPKCIREIKKFMYGTDGCWFANMSGTGSAVVGAYTNKKKRLAALREVRKYFVDYKAFAVEPCKGIEVLNKTRLH